MARRRAPYFFDLRELFRFEPDLRLLEDFRLLLLFFFGTFLPFFRASESPIAIACFRLFTLPPLPLLSVPFFFLCMARFTSLPALREYFAIGSSR